MDPLNALKQFKNSVLESVHTLGLDLRKKKMRGGYKKSKSKSKTKSRSRSKRRCKSVRR